MLVLCTPPGSVAHMGYSSSSTTIVTQHSASEADLEGLTVSTAVSISRMSPLSFKVDVGCTPFSLPHFISRTI